jgi:hypothetical protein
MQSTIIWSCAPNVVYFKKYIITVSCFNFLFFHIAPDLDKSSSTRQSRNAMVSLRYIALAASSIVGFAYAAPAEIASRQTFVPGTLNNTREFYISMAVTDGYAKYSGWRGMFPPCLIYPHI